MTIILIINFLLLKLLKDFGKLFHSFIKVIRFDLNCFLFIIQFIINFYSLLNVDFIKRFDHLFAIYVHQFTKVTFIIFIVPINFITMTSFIKVLTSILINLKSK